MIDHKAKVHTAGRKVDGTLMESVKKRLHGNGVIES